MVYGEEDGASTEFKTLCSGEDQVAMVIHLPHPDNDDETTGKTTEPNSWVHIAWPGQPKCSL